MAEEYSTVKVVGGVGFLAILVMLGIIWGGIFTHDRPPVKPPDPVPCSGGGPGCASKRAAGGPASDGSTCNSGYECQVNGAQCGPSNAGSCTTIPLGGGKCACSCAL